MTSPATSSPASKPEPTPTRRGGELDRRTIWLSAIVLFGVLIGGIALIAIFADPGSERQPTTTDSGAPHIIDRPNSGTPPTAPGDRGGSEQLLLLAGIIVSVGGIGYIAFRGGKKARANRERWHEAGRSGHDGAVGT